MGGSHTDCHHRAVSPAKRTGCRAVCDTAVWWPCRAAPSPSRAALALPAPAGGEEDRAFGIRGWIASALSSDPDSRLQNCHS